ncbi:DUF397 domain-containing protein [Streptomyces alkaliterrae]|uniref:DUF397 domain-containing protein n=1 Tax=Streptomyces alkaliterrae TaxID=2213162 RepID=A0A5P0YWH9_9ACTN|nr:DUF397 domain-containing protein [Streptomyces alkaliterrae]MBB1259018.1 DUF397 domain-containing protein [Streptomyces alkaliterrae]MQS04643.1 DUF397 domain-containing protein [Streptomyces alkaliterrae]
MSATLHWFKSSYSTEQGGNCLEVAYAWRKSSHSSDEGGACVEVGYAWRKSSRSTDEGGNCVEVAACPSVVHVRDSKNPDGPVLTLSPSTWSAFTAHVA